MKNKIKEDMKTLFKIFSLVVAMTLTAGTAYGAKMFYSTSINPQQWSTSATPTQDGADYTATLTGLTEGTQYFIAFSNTDSYSGVFSSFNTQCAVTVNSGVQKDDKNAWRVNTQEYNLDNNRYQYIWLYPDATDLVITYNNDNHAYTIGSAATTFTISTSLTGCTLDKTSAVVAAGDSAIFTVTPMTGYSFSSATITDGTGSYYLKDENRTIVVKPTNNTTLTVTGVYKTLDLVAVAPEGNGTVTPATMEDVVYGTNTVFTVTPATGYHIDAERTTFQGLAKGINATDEKVTLTYVQSSDTLKVYFKNDTRPTVYIGAYPTQGSGSEGANTVNLEGYVAKRFCTDITKAGFYWSTSKSISLSEVTTAIGGGTGSSNVITADTFKADTLIAGKSFYATNATLSGVSETKNVYFVAYATTTNGTNISRVVGLEFRYCNGIESVSLSPTSAKLPAGYSTVFTATPRGAGKSPVYTWYDNNVVISGATSSTLEYTMPNTATHTIKVVVSEESCGSSEYATATVETCAAPSIALTASPSSTTPWQPVTLTATLTNASQGAWTSDPEAEIIVSGFDENIDTAIMSAPVQSGDQTIYDVTYTAEGNQCGTTEVVTSATTKVTIVKDLEDCE